ncbi:MAG: T9SS type A sorting domain-containing protein [Flavicella sp.]
MSTSNMLGQGSFSELSKDIGVSVDCSGGENYDYEDCPNCPESRQNIIKDNSEWFICGGHVYVEEYQNDTWAVFGDNRTSRLRQLVTGLDPYTTYSIELELKKEGSEKVKKVMMGLRDFDNINSKFKDGISTATEVAGVSVFLNKRAEIARTAISSTEFTPFQFEYHNESATAVIFEINIPSESTSDKTFLDNVSFIKSTSQVLSPITVGAQVYFSIQPNPAIERVLLSSNKIIDHVHLYDFMGNLVVRKKSGFFKGEFSLSGVANGVYLLEAHIGNTKEIRKLIVK